MLESITFRCRPGAQFHFGKIALDENTSLDDTSHIQHSDSLTSAFIETAFRVLNDAAAQLVLSDFESGKVRVSSLFWRLDLQGGRSVHFLPKPVSFETSDSSLQHKVENVDTAKKESYRKDILRAQFISKGVWEAGILPNDWAEKCLVVQNEFVLTREEAGNLTEAMAKKMRLYQTVSLPKVAVHKLTREDSLYSQTNIQIANLSDYGLPGAHVHFYFLLESNDTRARDRVYNLACIMADDGIGGERSVGCGELNGIEEPTPFQLTPLKQEKGLFCSASLVSPASQEEFEKFLAWKVITRGGRRTLGDGTLYRLKMLAEGAMFISKVDGTTHIISEKAAHYKYRRFGMALCLPAHDHHQPTTSAP